MELFWAGSSISLVGRSQPVVVEAPLFMNIAGIARLTIWNMNQKKCLGDLERRQPRRLLHCEFEQIGPRQN